MKKIVPTLFTCLILFGTCDRVSACNTSDDEYKGDSAVKRRKTGDSDPNLTALPEPSKTDIAQGAKQLLINALNTQESYEGAIQYVRQNGLDYLRELASESRDAELFYGYCLRNSIGCQSSIENISQAVGIFRERALAEDPRAMYFYGIDLVTEKRHDRQTVETGFMWIRSAVKRYVKVAVPILIDCLRQGIGCAKTEDNFNEAVKLAASMENPRELNDTLKLFRQQRREKAKDITNKNIKELEKLFTNPLINKIVTGVYSPNILWALDLFPSTRIPEASAYLSWMCNNFASVNYGLFRETLEKLPPQDRFLKRDRCRKLTTNPEITKQVFRDFMMLIPEEEWPYLPSTFSDLLGRLEKSDYTPFIKAIQEIDEKERFNKITNASFFLEDINSANGIVDMFKAINSLSEDERLSLTTIDAGYLKLIKNGKARIVLLKWLLKRPVQSRRDRLGPLRERLINCKSAKECEIILKDVKE